MKHNIITIGSDPEFVVTKNGEQIRADEIFRPLRDERCTKVDRETICGRRCTIPNLFCGHGAETPIGQDCGLGELRPQYGNVPLEHKENIKDLFKNIDIPQNYHLYGGTKYEDNLLGGHIHIGVNVSSPQQLADYLSFFCGIPLKKIERPNDLKIRGRKYGEYGYFGGYDTKPYGMEFRMPASWLCSQEITMAALSLAYVCAQEYKKHPTKLIISHSAYLALLDGNINHIITGIEKMEYYPLYHSEIEPLFQMVVNGIHWDVDRDLLEEWT